MDDGGARPRGPFECPASEAITFHLVEPGGSGEDPWHLRASFHPEFTHQLFGEDEVIVGYQDLKINLYQHAASFLTHVDIKYGQKLQKSGPRRKVHDLTSILKENFPSGFCKDREEFAKQLPVHSAEFPGLLEKHGKRVVISTPRNEAGEPSADTLYEVWHMDLKEPAVQQWHSRFQPSTLFFIETASLIDSEDPQWELWVAVERQTTADAPTLTVAGFCTAFRFFHWPDDTRLRISQVLVLPPYQGRGHGMRLLEAASAEAKDKACYDLTVEDPNDALQSLRESLDAHNLLAFPPVQDALTAALAKCEKAGPPPPPAPSAAECASAAPAANGARKENGSSSRSPTARRENPLALGKEVAEEVRKELKISHRQMARCWEVLLWMRLKESEDTGAREWWKLLVLRRLYAENLGGGREAKAAHGKRIVDTLEKEDGKMMFVMFRSRKRPRPSGENTNGSAGAGAAEEEDEDGVAKQELTEEELTQKKREALSELFALREEDISVVCERVEKMSSRV